MNEVILNKMLSGTLIVPFEEKFAQQLCKTCEKYVSSSAFKEEQIYECTMAFLVGSDNTKVLVQMYAKYETEYHNKIILPPLVARRIAGFLVYLAATRPKERGRAKSIAASATMMNCMITCHGQYEKVPCPDVIAKMYGRLDEIMQEKGVSPVTSMSDFAIQVLKDPSALKDRKLTTAEVDELRHYINRIYKKDVEASLQTEVYRSIINPYVRIFVALSNIVHGMKWNYHNFDIMELIRKIVPQTDTEEEHLDAIVKNICDSGYVKHYAHKYPSSILLRLISGDDNLGHMAFAKAKFSLEEFAVYLYYELLFEKLNRNY